MKVSRKEEEVGRVPLSDLAVLVVSARSATISADLLRTLAEQDAITVVCDSKYHPSALVLPYGRHPASSDRMQAQIAASVPLKKQLWKQIVRQKILNQERVSAIANNSDHDQFLLNCADAVKSGDTDNREAVAAQHYWKRVFGQNFRRSDEDNPTNSFLNYGYAIIRASAARAVCAAGLLPFWALHHSGRVNPYSLADDLMEPFRPAVDLLVLRLVNSGCGELNPVIKRYLARVLQLDFQTDKGTSPVAVAQLDMAQSLGKAFTTKSSILPQISLNTHIDDEEVCECS